MIRFFRAAAGGTTYVALTECQQKFLADLWEQKPEIQDLFPGPQGLQRMLRHYVLRKNEAILNWNSSPPNLRIHYGAVSKDLHHPKTNQALSIYLNAVVRAPSSLHQIVESEKKLREHPVKLQKFAAGEMAPERNQQISAYGMPESLKDQFTERWLSNFELRRSFGVDPSEQADSQVSMKTCETYLAALSQIGSTERRSLDDKNIRNGKPWEDPYPGGDFVKSREIIMAKAMLNAEEKVIREFQAAEYAAELENANMAGSVAIRSEWGNVPQK